MFSSLQKLVSKFGGLPKLPTVPFPFAWTLGFGVRDIPPQAERLDDDCALVGARAEFGLGNRCAVVGDIRLGNRRTLLDRLDCSELTPDARIVASLWEIEGPDSVSRLEGSFAFAVHDRHEKNLTLARDPSGTRTLYYTLQGTTVWVSPRLRELHPRHSKSVDLVALRDYLCCAFVPGERTMWRDVLEVRPGTTVRFPDFRTSTFWEVDERIEAEPGTLEDYAGQLRSRLEAVVAEYLPSDEPVGVYLSGGLDSSAITALAKHLHTHPVHTYSIHFGDETPNELEFSSLVAEHCRTKHHVIEIRPADMWDLHPQALAWLDDPIGDPLTVPNLILGQAAREDVRVILNGEGGDPCFGGPKNQPMLLGGLYRSAVEHGGRAFNPTIDSTDAYLASFQKCSPDLDRLLRPEAWKAVRDVPSVFTADLRREASYLNRLMMINIKYKGADHILTKVGNLTRALGIEGRSPLFDHRVVDFSLRVPPEFKLSGTEEKAVLKAAVADIVPRTILDRPKSGMMVPVQYWFRNLWPDRARALLLNRKAALAEYLDQNVIAEWLDYRGDVWGRYGVKLWLLAALETWLRIQGK